MEYRGACEKCNRALGAQEVAFVCQFECTWCALCAAGFAHVCPNCAGELVRRPRKGKAAELPFL